jgi:type VI protein secretion system component VasK
MTEPTRDELLRRIEQLERANRRWRRRSFVVAGLLAVGLVASMAENYRKVMNARQQAELARQQAEQARQAAEGALKQAQDAAEQAIQRGAKSLVNRPKKASEIPLDLDDRLWPLRRIDVPRSIPKDPLDRAIPRERP